MSKTIYQHGHKRMHAPLSEDLVNRLKAIASQRNETGGVHAREVLTGLTEGGAIAPAEHIQALKNFIECLLGKRKEFDIESLSSFCLPRLSNDLLNKSKSVNVLNEII